MSFTYSGLKTAIQNYMDNDETTFTNTLDTFIKLSEEKILKTVQLDGSVKGSAGLDHCAYPMRGNIFHLLWSPIILTMRTWTTPCLFEKRSTNG